MLTTEEILETVKTALELDRIPSMEDSVESIEEWDSLGHLSMLVALDEKLNGKAAKLQELGSCQNITQLISILKKNKLIES